MKKLSSISLRQAALTVDPISTLSALLSEFIPKNSYLEIYKDHFALSKTTTNGARDKKISSKNIRSFSGLLFNFLWVAELIYMSLLTKERGSIWFYHLVVFDHYTLYNLSSQNSCVCLTKSFWFCWTNKKKKLF